MDIYQSITNIMQESIAIGKEKFNKSQGFKYRGIDDVMNTFYPLLSKHKVFVVPEVLEQTREERETKSGGNLIYSILKIKYTFYAEDGSSVSAVVMGEGMDSADKSSNKAMAVGMKYAMFQVFCIPTEDIPDPDGETPPPSKKRGNNEFGDIPPESTEQIQMPLTLHDAENMQLPVEGGVILLKNLTIGQLERVLNNKDMIKYHEAVKIILSFKAQENVDERKD